MTSAVLKMLLIASLSNHNDNDGNKKIKKTTSLMNKII